MAKRTFSAEFKREAVRLAKQPGMAKTKVARELGIHVNVLRKWVENCDAGKWSDEPGTPLRNPKDLEIEQLKKELQRVKAERDILKKAAAYFAKESG